jgi:hypothetical protein
MIHDHKEPTPAATGDIAAHDPSRRPPEFWRSKAGIAAIVFLLIGGFFLVSEHRAHALGYLPFLLIFGCLFIHMFMHGEHGGHSGHGSGKPTPEKPNRPSQRS